MKSDNHELVTVAVWSLFLGSYEDPFAVIGGACLSACRVSRGLLGGIQ